MKSKGNKGQVKGETEDPDHGLYEAIGLIENQEEAKQFFTDLCTPAELQEMVDRWWVVGFIKRRLTYREIHEITGVSVTTIGRVARFVTHGADGYNIIHERLKKRKYAESTKIKNSHSKKGKIV